ncbi:MAG: hypothetical protein M0R51_05970 [Clostridia bacterium]|jgi:hypothetical protein|nr:hypothetical protein [Clostridia bacterium]
MKIKPAILTIMALSPFPVGMYVEYAYGESTSLIFAIGMLYGAVAMLILNPRESIQNEINGVLEEEREWLKNN